MDFSVVITSHNCKEFVEEALRSVFNQVSPPKEVIVVDDASSDGSVEFLRQLQREYPFRLLVNERNLERCKTRNRGAEASSSDWVCFLDCDDLWTENHLSTVRETVEKIKDARAFYAPPKGFVDRYGKVIKLKKPPGEGFRKLLLTGRVGYPSGSCFERRAFLQSGGYSNRHLMREDWEIFLRYQTGGFKVAFRPSGEYFIREHENRTGKGRKFLKATLRVVNDYKKVLPTEDLRFLKLHLAVQCLRFGKPQCGRRLFISLLKENPKILTEKREMWEVVKRLIGRRRR